MTEKHDKIVILGWGSLLWDVREDFKRWHVPWEFDGPSLKLEFSRLSTTRQGALTLVIDPINGRTNTVAYCTSKRRLLEDAIADLRCREGTIVKKIGFICRSESRYNCRDKDALTAINSWAEKKNIDKIVWTDLESNFRSRSKFSSFSVKNAIAHLKTLGPADKAKAAEYVWRAPDSIRTDLRDALEVEPWFLNSE